MGIFEDTFQRADGAAANGWVGLYSAANITSHTLYLTDNGGAMNSNTLSSTYQDVTVVVAGTGYLGQRGGPSVRSSISTLFAFSMSVTGTARPYTLGLGLGSPYTGSSITSVPLDVDLPPSYTLRLVWDNGHILGYYQGTLKIDITNPSQFGDLYAGVNAFGRYTTFLSFRCVTDSPISLVVAPSVIPNYGGACSTVTLTGSGTSWTPGTPGVPTFTVDHGTISAQTVTSATSATLTYCPGNYLGAVAFTDPTTGATAGAVVTSDTSLVPPGGTALSADAIAYLDRSARAEDESIILNRNESWTGYGVTKTMSETIETVHNTLSQSTYAVDGQAGILALIIQVYDLLNGGSDWGGTATVFGNTSLIKADVDSLASALSDVQGPGGVSLAVLAAALSDLRGVGAPSLADILAASSGGGDSSAVLAAIAAVRGSGSPDLRALADKADSLRTTHGYDLGTVKTWIDALPQAQSGPSAALIIATVAALALAIPTGGASVAAEAVAIGAGPLLDLTTLVEVASVLGEVAGIASSIASLRDSLGPPQIAAPVWPGADLVTLGVSHDLADGLIVDGPMHGLLVTIGGHPSGAGKYTFGSVDSWQHCGAVIFQDDAGHYERAESFGLPSQILTPHTMASAASATVRLNGGWSGTIRGWTVTA